VAEGALQALDRGVHRLLVSGDDQEADAGGGQDGELDRRGLDAVSALVDRPAVEVAAPLEEANRNSGTDFGLSALVARAQVRLEVGEEADKAPLNVRGEQPVRQRVLVSPVLGCARRQESASGLI
jgi:hypothetical protein